MKISVLKMSCLAAVVFFVSCDNGDKQSLVNETSAAGINVPVSDGNPLPAQEIATTTSGNVKLNPKHGEPGHRCEIAVGAPLNSEDNKINNLQPVPVAPANSAAATPANATNSLLSLPNLPSNNSKTSTNGQVKLNPKHGEPGHRCDVAVGAPLNGGSTAPATTPVPALSLPAPVAAPAITNSGNVKLNPKHGEPGHRCDIQVGAPLTSSTATSQPNATTAFSNPAAPIGAAALPALQLPNTGNNSKPKINPKHGEPGHRCDIAVGAALN